jgi:hypothetical protein
MHQFLRYFLAATLLLPLCSIGQKAEALVEWNANRRLTWEDYKANPDMNSGAAASTTTFLGIEYNFSNGNFGYKITSNFSKDRSWGLHKTDYILSHEQGHFDIAEVYARKLNKEMAAYKFNRSTFQQDLKRIYDGVLNEKEKTQDDYDRETNHSIKKEKQAEWLEKIARLLEEYKDYADYRTQPGSSSSSVSAHRSE